ncbi:MAG: hypothetical protein ABSH20_16710 [Tepidisphaeraceae bacterium]|jgi:serine/threonine-protein kinase ATR
MKPPALPLLAILSIATLATRADDTTKTRPLMRDFIGLNTHTVQFKPELYKPVCRLLRNYHPAEWDLGKDTAVPPPFPEAKNRVNWSTLYGAWTKAGYEIDSTLMLASIKPDGWRSRVRDVETYGRLVTQNFGPSGVWPVLASVEVDNEPADYPPQEYRAMFTAMARGMRAADPKLKISTCALSVKRPGKWAKPVDCIAGLNDLYDILNLHTYAFAERWPTWRRTFPEDPKTEYLAEAADMIAWRNANAPGKAIWITEFGFDAGTQPSPTDGPNKGFTQCTETQQAQWIVRSFLVFASMDVDRAYLYWFNDDDKVGLHAASGITRKFQPKPSFHAMAQMYALLGDYRFSKAIVRKENDCYAFEFTHASEPGKRIIVAWSPTGSDRKAQATITVGGRVERAPAMQTAAGAAAEVPFKQTAAGDVSIEIGESVVYLIVGG